MKKNKHLLKSLLPYTPAKSLAIVFFTCLFIANPAVSQNIEREIKMGNETQKAIEQQIGFYQHASGEYLNKIGSQLVSNLDQPKHDYHFGIIEMQEPNAMALPNGQVYFSRGILVLANSEQELAGVMGHEIMHVHQSHSRKSSNKSSITSILKLPGALVGVFVPVAGNILTNPVKLFDAGYSRKHEKQADELGAQLTAKSGYNPEGLLSILGKIAMEQELKSNSEEIRSFYNTHPYTPERINDLKKVISKLDYEESSGSNTEHELFLKRIEGIVMGENPANGTFIDTLFIHPELKFTLSYPQGWEGINLPTMVGFISPDQKAQLVLTLSDPAKSAATLAEDYAKNHFRNYGTEPNRSETLKINGHPAHILGYEVNSEKGLMVYSTLWLKRDQRMYRFVMISAKAHEMAILDMANSLHVMTKDQRDRIQQTVLRMVKAKQGETLENLSTRTGNVLQPEFTALINDLEKGNTLTEGQWVKIGLLENY